MHITLRIMTPVAFICFIEIYAWIVVACLAKQLWLLEENKNNSECNVAIAYKVRK